MTNATVATAPTAVAAPAAVAAAAAGVRNGANVRRITGLRCAGVIEAIVFDLARGRRQRRSGRIQGLSPNTSVSPLVAVIMGSTSDWDTMKHAVEVLERF